MIAIEPLEGRLLYARLVGIDVSHWQPSVNWATVHNVGGKDFAFVRASHGLGPYDDEFLNNVNPGSGVVANGMYVGFYHYAEYNLGNTAIQEADYFYNRVAPYLLANGKTLMPVLDVEASTSGFTAATLSQWCIDWCNRVSSRALSEKGLVVNPIIYGGAFNAGGLVDDTLKQTYPDWIPSWPNPMPNPQTANPSNTGAYANWSFWQYAGDPAGGPTGTCPGVGNGTTTPCDLDVFNGDQYDIKDYVIGSAGHWTDGSWVQTTTSSLSVWNDSTCNSASPYNDTSVTVPLGTIGKILDGPVYGNSYMRYKVQFNNGVTGWAAAWYLDTTAPAAPTNPNPSGTVGALPTAFAWTGAATATSYDVYLDGVFQANVATNSWTHGTIAQGSHNWQVLAKNAEVSTGSVVWNFTYDTGAPTAFLQSATPVTGAATLDFGVIYVDGLGVKVSTLDSNDLTISGPNGYTATPTFISVNNNTNGSPRIATYRISAPGGFWNDADSGAYTVTQVANQVSDVNNSFRAAGTIGTYNFAPLFGWVSGGVLKVAFDNSGAPIALTTAGGNIRGTKNGFTYTLGNAPAVSIIGSAGDDTIQVQDPLAAPITFDNSGGNDLLEVLTGTYTFPSDIATPTRNVGVHVAAGATAVFNSSQHLRSLSVDGTATLTSGGNKLLWVKDLQITGKLNLTNNSLAWEYTTGTPIGAWAENAYDGLTGQIISGRNGGSWNGVGLVTDQSNALGGTPKNTLAVSEASSALGAGGGVFAGESVDGTTVLVRYTFAADANLNGDIDGDDFWAIDNSYNTPGPLYERGDFDLNGRMDADDYWLLDTNYSRT